MIKSRIALAGGLLAVAGAAQAGFTVSPAVTSDYDFRGVSQTLEDPAFQLGVNYGHDNGFYAGVWGSNVDFGSPDPDVEIDLYTGFAGGDAAETFGYDVGVVYYMYPNASSGDTFELYAGISKSIFSAKLWYSPNVASSSNDGFYVEGNIAYPLPANFTLKGHIGYSFGDAAVSSAVEETDYSIGVDYTFKNLVLGVKYVDGSGVLSNRDMTIFTVSTTLPWASE